MRATQRTIQSDIQMAIALQRSFNFAAVTVFLLYMFFWLPGLIANLMFISEANGVERFTGREPVGKFALQFLFVVFGILLPVTTFLVFFLAVRGATGYFVWHDGAPQ